MPRTPRVAAALAALGAAAALAAVAAPTAATATPVGASVPAPAHGYHLAVGDQQTDDGRVVVGPAFLVTDGYVVLRADDGGEPGEVLGHAAVDAGPHRRVEVAMDDARWSRFRGTATLWATIHTDDGDGSFDPGDDGLAPTVGGVPGERFALERAAAGKTHVIAAAFGGHEVADARPAAAGPPVRLPQVALAADGYLVVAAGDVDGRIVGRRALAAGVHENVTVRLDGGFVARQGRIATLYAVVYRDDGDGTFTGADEPFTVAGAAVHGRFRIRAVNRSAATAPTLTPALVRTPTRTAAASPAAGTGPTGAGTPAATASAAAPGVDLPSVLAALGALAALAALAGRRSGGRR